MPSAKAPAINRKPGHTLGVPGFRRLFYQELELERSGRRVSGWHASRGITVGGRRIVSIVGHVIRLALGLALELFFFFAFFRKLFLALFVGIVGSCHCVLSSE
jgi:hypothetical protein